MTALLSYQIVTTLVVIATSVAYFFIRLYQVRMLTVERQKKGLVSHSVSLGNKPITWP